MLVLWLYARELTFLLRLFLYPRLPVSKCITALSAIRADVNTLTYVRKACSYLMSRQLLRSDGVRGLLLALFPDDEVSEENAPLEKLESVSRVLQTIPAGMTASVSVLSTLKY